MIHATLDKTTLNSENIPAMPRIPKTSERGRGNISSVLNPPEQCLASAYLSTVGVAMEKRTQIVDFTFQRKTPLFTKKAVTRTVQTVQDMIETARIAGSRVLFACPPEIRDVLSQAGIPNDLLFASPKEAVIQLSRDPVSMTVIREQQKQSEKVWAVLQPRIVGILDASPTRDLLMVRKIHEAVREVLS